MLVKIQWFRINVLALRPKVRRFKPSLPRWGFSGRKSPEQKSTWRDFKQRVRV